jgi:DNA-directed RNA polymerase subunit beta'
MSDKPTTLGQYLVAEAFPEGYRPAAGDQLTKKKLYSALQRVAKDRPEQYGEVVANAKRVGDIVATTYGLSVGLDDIEPDYVERDKIIKDAKAELSRAKDDGQRRKILASAQARALELAPKHHSDMALMARAGGRGNAAQLMRTVVSPVAATDADGSVIPWLIERSYAEGLTAAEAWVAGKEARVNVVSSKNAVSEPGAFGKLINANMLHQVVTQEDCGTDNGVHVDPSDPNNQDRVIAAGETAALPGSVLDGKLATQLAAKGIARVRVRTPLVCETPDGLCSRCWGLDERGKFPQIGTHLGVRSGQAMAEPLTQFTLNAKHGVRTAGGGDSVLKGLKGLSAYLDFPESFTHRAVLAPKAGVVKRVDAAPQGGHFIQVSDDKPVYIAATMQPTVKVGDSVRAGDALCDGVPMPNDIVKFQGLGAARKAVASQVHKIFKGEGLNLDPRHTELLARAHMGYVRVVDDPDGEYGTGDIVPYAAVASKYGSASKEVPLDSAAGMTLAKPASVYTAGTRITSHILEGLKGDGVTKVHVHTGGFDTRPVVTGLTRSPLLDKDWMTRLGHRYLLNSIVEGASAGDVSDTRGTSPIPGYLVGQGFGGGHSGRY